MSPTCVELTPESVDALIDRWEKECCDLHPNNVDSMDRVVDPSVATSYEAICLLPTVLVELRRRMEKPKNFWGRMADWLSGSSS